MPLAATVFPAALDDLADEADAAVQAGLDFLAAYKALVTAAKAKGDPELPNGGALGVFALAVTGRGADRERGDAELPHLALRLLVNSTSFADVFKVLGVANPGHRTGLGATEAELLEEKLLENL